jgi:hypothetical protein
LSDGADRCTVRVRTHRTDGLSHGCPVASGYLSFARSAFGFGPSGAIDDGRSSGTGTAAGEDRPTLEAIPLPTSAIPAKD